MTMGILGRVNYRSTRLDPTRLLGLLVAPALFPFNLRLLPSIKTKLTTHMACLGREEENPDGDKNP